MKKILSVVSALLLLLMLGVTAFAEEESEIVELYIQMTVSMEDGAIKADLIDSQQGTVSTWPVSLEIDGEQVDTVNTDEYGTATFYYAIPDDTQTIGCVAHDGQFDNYRFIGCTVYLDYAPVSDEETEETEESEAEDESDESDESETTTTVQTTTSVLVATTTTAKNEPANATPMTTTVKGDLVSVGIVPDNALLIASGSTSSDYQSDARLWMNHTLYRSLVPPSSSSLQLQLALDTQAGDMSRLIAAKNADPAFSSYTDEEVKGFAMSLTVVYVDGVASVPLEIEDNDYTIEMPVPSTLKNAEKIALSVCTSEGLAQLVEVKPSGGMLNFTIHRFQTLALVGFGTSTASMNTLFGTPWLLVLVIVLGLVMVAGGIVLLVFVVFRRKKTEEADIDSQAEEPSSQERVSLDAEDEDAVYVAPAPVSPKPAGNREQNEPTEDRTVQKPQEAPVAPLQPTPAVPAGSTKAVSVDELDDLLDEVLNGLDG